MQFRISCSHSNYSMLKKKRAHLHILLMFDIFGINHRSQAFLQIFYVMCKFLYAIDFLESYCIKSSKFLDSNFSCKTIRPYLGRVIHSLTSLEERNELKIYTTSIIYLLFLKSKYTFFKNSTPYSKRRIVVSCRGG